MVFLLQKYTICVPIVNETQYHQDVFGVYIDIFPIDGYKDKKQISKLKWINKFLHTKKSKFHPTKAFKKK